MNIDTGGNILFTPTYCECGLTGGCEKCHPSTTIKIVGRVAVPKFIFPDDRSENFMDDKLKEFYKKKGYIYE